MNDDESKFSIDDELMCYTSAYILSWGCCVERTFWRCHDGDLDYTFLRLPKPDDVGCTHYVMIHDNRWMYS